MKGVAFCGAFNPPTKAHIEVAKEVREKLNLDYVIFVPSKQEYIQNIQKKDFVFCDKERLDMLKKIANNYPWMVVSEYELKLKYQPRTYETLKALQTQGYQISLLFGSDKLPEFEYGWHYVDEMAKEFGFVILCRNGENAEMMVEENPYLNRLKPFMTFVKTDNQYQYISSTLVRKYFKEMATQYCELEKLLPKELEGLKVYL